MDRMSIETRVLVVTFYQFNENSEDTVRRLRILLRRDVTPNVLSICRLIKNSKKLVQLLISKALVRLRRPHKTLQRELRKVVVINFLDRTSACQQANGGQWNNIIFHR